MPKAPKATAMDKQYAKEEAEYRAKRDMETIAEAERIKGDPERMKQVERLYKDLKGAMTRAKG